MNTKPNTTQKVFLSGVLLLTLSTILVKVVGLLYKIPMLSYLGSEGMGYFHSAYEIYAIFCSIARAFRAVRRCAVIFRLSPRASRRFRRSILFSDNEQEQPTVALRPKTNGLFTPLKRNS